MPFNPLAGGFGLVDGRDGRVLANFGRGTAILGREADGAWSVDTTTFSRFGRGPSGFLFTDPDGMVWFTWNRRPARALRHARSARPPAPSPRWSAA